MKKLLVVFLVFCNLGISAQSRLKAFLENPSKTEILKLDLHRCKLKEWPSELWQCKNLEHLDLSKNDLDDIPPDIEKLQNLKVLILSKNQIQKISPSLKKLPLLIDLQLDQNPIDSLLLKEGDFPSLQILDLWDAEVKYISPLICELKSLKELDLRRNFLGTRDLDWLFKCREELKIESTWGCDCD